MKSNKRKIITTSVFAFTILVPAVFIFTACGKQEYKVGFDANDGSSISYITYKGDEAIKRPTDPIRNGYNFAGWYDNQSFIGEEFNFNETPEKNFTLYAKWEPINYTISYDLAGGEVSGNPNTYNIETNIRLNNPTRVGYNFLGWTYLDVTEPSLQVDLLPGLTGNINFTANWAIKKSNVSIEANNDEYGHIETNGFDNTAVPYGSEISIDENTITINGTTITATPSSSDGQYLYSFVKWQINGDDYNNQTITGDTTITATFSREVNTYTITLQPLNASEAAYAYGQILNEQESSQSYIFKVPYGTAIETVTEKSLSIQIYTQIYTLTAKPLDDDDEHIYSFVKWQINGEDYNNQTIAGDTKITAVFKSEARLYTARLEVNNPSMGSVTVNGVVASEISDVNYIALKNKLFNAETLVSFTINDKTVATEVSNSSLYEFDQWTYELQDNGSPKKELVITANFKAL